MHSVSLLICTHNRAEILAQTLASLEQLQIPEGVRADLVVVVNACRDNTTEVATSCFSKLPLAARCVVESTPGLSIARNRALEESTGNICAFLDDDVRVDSQWLHGLIEVFEKYPADVVAGRVLLWWQDVKKPLWWTEGLSSLLSESNLGDAVQPTQIPYHYIGANFAFRRAVYQQIGGFSPHLGRIGKGMLAGEETDFLRRAFAAGFQGYYAPHASLEHWVAPERVTSSYLISAAYGRGYSQVVMKPRLGPVSWMRCVLGHAWLWFSASIRVIVAKLTQPDGYALPHQVQAAIGRGGLAGVVARLFGKRSATA